MKQTSASSGIISVTFSPSAASSAFLRRRRWRAGIDCKTMPSTYRQLAVLGEPELFNHELGENSSSFMCNYGETLRNSWNVQTSYIHWWIFRFTNLKPWWFMVIAKELTSTMSPESRKLGRKKAVHFTISTRSLSTMTLSNKCPWLCVKCHVLTTCIEGTNTCASTVSTSSSRGRRSYHLANHCRFQWFNLLLKLWSAWAYANPNANLHPAVIP